MMNTSLIQEKLNNLLKYGRGFYTNYFKEIHITVFLVYFNVSVKKTLQNN